LQWKSTERPPSMKNGASTLFGESATETPEETRVREEKENAKKAAWLKVETVALRYGVQTGM